MGTRHFLCATYVPPLYPWYLSNFVLFVYRYIEVPTYVLVYRYLWVPAMFLDVYRVLLLIAGGALHPLFLAAYKRGVPSTPPFLIFIEGGALHPLFLDIYRGGCSAPPLS